MRTGADILVRALENENVELIFAYPGGANLEILDCLRDSSVRIALSRHEQGAAHEASGYARVSGKPGVCLATSGPGATNLVTGIAAAYMDSVPLVVITGQVMVARVGTDAFQEVDVTGITGPITKHNYFIKDADSVARTVKEAFYIASSGRPGPVLIDFPRDIAGALSSVESVQSINLRGYKPNLKGHAGQIKQVVQLLSRSSRPVLIAGGGVIISGSWAETLRLAENQQIPVASSMMGIGSVPFDHPLALGMAGAHGLPAANRAIQKSDLIIGLGTRFSDRLTCDTKSFAPHAKIVHIDVDPAEIGKNIRADVPIVGDLRIVLGQLLEKLEPANRGEWLEEIAALKAAAYSATGAAGASDASGVSRVAASDASGVSGAAASGASTARGLLPLRVMEAIGKAMPDDVIITSDVGQHQIWAATGLPHRGPRRFISSGGLGAMGYGIPAAIGAMMASPGAPVLCVSGDGSFQMGLPELGTAAEQGLPLKILLINNGSLGLVKQLQDYYCDGRRTASAYSFNPDFGALIRAYGGGYYLAADEVTLAGVLPVFFADDRLALLEVRVSGEENALPMVLAGDALDAMTGV